MSEKNMNNKNVTNILEKLSALYPEAVCTLDFANPLQLLIATQLAAQCTDARVNIVTKTLFPKYPTVEHFANAEISVLENDIRSTGFYHNKAKNIIGCCKMLLEKHNGEVPNTMEALLELPGVGRKTANVVLGVAFDIPGMVVDTHCKRIAKRLGLTENEDPTKVEFDLMKLIPKEWWTRFGHMLVFYGRDVCTARRPNCDACVIFEYCARKGFDV